MNSALFFRKCSGTEELNYMNEHLPLLGEELYYHVIKKIKLNDRDFNNFKSDFFKDRKYIKDVANNLVFTPSGIVKCLLITNLSESERYLVYSSGYSYARYVAPIS